jgi:hypothetical protein
MALRIPSTFTGGNVANPINLPDGSITVPSLGWTSDADGSGTGFYRSGSNIFNEVFNGTRQVVHSGSGTGMLTTYLLGWYSTAFAALDCTLGRSGAGRLAFKDNTGAAHAFLGGGPALASATALPTATDRLHHVTGTTTITSWTTTNIGAGTVVTLIFDGVLTFTDGNNLKLAGDFTTTTDDTITLIYDGSAWFELCRTVT